MGYASELTLANLIWVAKPYICIYLIIRSLTPKKDSILECCKVNFRHTRIELDEHHSKLGEETLIKIW